MCRLIFFPRRGFLTIMVASLAALSFQCSTAGDPPEKSEEPTISRLLLESDEFEGWTTVDSPQYVMGEDLFTLINGGAEIYHEYGFKQAIIHTYESAGRRSINLEVYEMESPEAAFGIFSFKTGDEGRAVSIGNDAFLESYFLNFWKGPFLVTLVGFDTEPETLDAIVEMARRIDGKIEKGGDAARPKLVRYLPKDGLNASSVVYLKGNLALFNNYEFDSANIFGVREGVIGGYGESRRFLFAYDSEEEAVKWFGNGRDRLKNKEDTSDFVDEESEFSFVDDKGIPVYGSPFRDTIVIIIGESPDDARRSVDEVKKKIATIESNS